MRIGELLIQQGLVTDEQLKAILTAQRQIGGRIGSLLVHYGYLDEDTLARVLSHQLGVPAVLSKHFAAVSPDVLKLFPARIASSYKAIPLGFTTAKPVRLIVAFRDPLSTPTEELSFIAGTRVEVGVAPECLIERHLEKFYGVKREARFVEVNFADMTTPSSAPPPPLAPVFSRGPATAPKVAAQAPQLSLDPAEPLHSGAPARKLLSPPPPSAPGAALAIDAGAMWIPAPEPPPPVVAMLEAPSEPVPAPAEPERFLSDMPPIDPGSLMQPVERKKTSRRPARAKLSVPPPDLGAPLSLEAVEQVLASATTRDGIGDALSDYLRSACGCGLVLIAKDDTALGWKGFAPTVDASVIEGISLPLTSPSVFRTATETREPFRGPPPADGAALQRRLWKLLRCAPPAEIVVVPVTVGKRVVNLVYAHGITGEALPESAIAGLSRVCAAASAGYARLIRKKK